MTSRQWDEWREFHRQNPIGRGRFDYLTALVRSTILATASGKEVEVASQMPVWFKPPVEVMSGEQMKSAVRSVAPPAPPRQPDPTPAPPAGSAPNTAAAQAS